MHPMPLIYVATPYADTTPAGIQRNIRFAEMVCLLVAQAAGAPYAPHLLLTRFLHDAIPEQRDLGIQAGLRTMEGADAFLAALPPWRTALSRGMTAEHESAQRLDIPCYLCLQPSDLDAFLEKLRAGRVVRRAPSAHAP